MFYDVNEIIENATIAGLTVTTNPTSLRPALAAGETCLWIGAPETIDFDGYGQGTCTWATVIVHPNYRDHMAALPEMLALAETLEPRLAVTRIRPDTIDLAGTVYPALELSFETTFRK